MSFSGNHLSDEGKIFLGRTWALWKWKKKSPAESDCLCVTDPFGLVSNITRVMFQLRVGRYISLNLPSTSCFLHTGLPQATPLSTSIPAVQYLKLISTRQNSSYIPSFSVVKKKRQGLGTRLGPAVACPAGYDVLPLPRSLASLTQRAGLSVWKMVDCSVVPLMQEVSCQWVPFGGTSGGLSKSLSSLAYGLLKSTHYLLHTYMLYLCFMWSICAPPPISVVA